MAVVEEHSSARWRAVLRDASRWGDVIHLGPELAGGPSTPVYEDAEWTAIELHLQWWHETENRLAIISGLDGDDAEAQWREVATLAGEAEWMLRQDAPGLIKHSLGVTFEEDGDTGPEFIVGARLPGGRAAVFDRIALPACFDLDGRRVGHWAPAQETLIEAAAESFRRWCERSEKLAISWAQKLRESIVAAAEEEPAIERWFNADTGAIDAEGVCAALSADILETPGAAAEAVLWRVDGSEASVWEPYRAKVIVSELGAGSEQRSVRVEFVDVRGDVAVCERMRWASEMTASGAVSAAVAWSSHSQEDAWRARGSATIDAMVSTEHAPAGTSGWRQPAWDEQPALAEAEVEL